VPENTNILEIDEDKKPKIRFLRKRRVHFFAELIKSSPVIATLIKANGVHSSRIEIKASNVQEMNFKEEIFDNILTEYFIAPKIPWIKDAKQTDPSEVERAYFRCLVTDFSVLSKYQSPTTPDITTFSILIRMDPVKK